MLAFNQRTSLAKEWEEASFTNVVKELNQGNRISLCMMDLHMQTEISVGHALNKILKIFIVRSKIRCQVYAPIPGWDTHGANRAGVLADKVSSIKMDLVEYLKLCRGMLSQVDKQREDFKRLGVSGDWGKPLCDLDSRL